MELKFHSHLTVLGSDPSPDIYVRALVDTLAEGWDPNLLPVLFAAECKQAKTHSLETKAQLATALQATLIILILYYLDTRHSQDSPCPPWLFLYGVIYTEDGMWIHAHHPIYDHRAACWRLKSTLVTDKFQKIFQSKSKRDIRIRGLVALLKIRSHSLFVLQRLEDWRRGSEVLKVFGMRSKSKNI